MEKLFTLDFTVSLNPYNLADIDEQIKDFDKRERVLSYIQGRMDDYGFDHLDTNYKFYIFKKEIKLPNYPKRPRQNNHCYFTIKEIFSGKELIQNSTEEAHILYNKNNNSLGELNEQTDYIEGAIEQVLVNKYERNSKARQECLNYYGYSCYICGFESK